jgi:hypothetical protein
MFASIWGDVPFGKSEVNQIDQTCFLTLAYQDVLWFHISVEEVLRVHKFQSVYDSNAYQQHCLQVELLIAVLE